MQKLRSKHIILPGSGHHKTSVDRMKVLHCLSTPVTHPGSISGLGEVFRGILSG